MSRLTITSGPDQGKVYELGDTQILGRLERNAIPLKDTRASRQHARIYQRGNAFFVVDLNSKNGIIHNGQEVRKAELSPGDTLKVGETWMRIDYDRDAVSPKVTSAAASTVATPGGAADIRLRGKDGTGSVSDRALLSGGGAKTRTSLAWLRTDLAQVSGLYRVLVALGILLVVAGLGYLAFALVA